MCSRCCRMRSLRNQAEKLKNSCCYRKQSNLSSAIRVLFSYTVVMLLIIETMGVAQTPISKGTRIKKSLTLSDCLRMAIENNYQLKSSRLSARSTGTNVAVSESEFDPVINSSGSYTDSKSPTASSLEGTSGFDDTASSIFIGNLGPSFSRSSSNSSQVSVPERQRYNLNLTLTKKLETGARVEASYSFQRLKTNQFFATINPSISNQMQLRISQPLLRGGWFAVNLSNLRQEQNNLEIACEQLRSDTDELIFNVQKTYWDLVYALEDLEVKRESLKLAEILKRDNEEKYKAGTMTQLDVIHAKYEISTRKNEVLQAMTILENSMDTLRQFVDPEGIKSPFVEEWYPVDRPLQKGNTFPELIDALKEAFQNRGDWQELLLNYENARLDEESTRNELLPALDIASSISYSGIGSNARDPFNDVIDREFDTWSFEFSFEFPIGNRSARARYLKASLNRRKIQADIEELRSRIHVDIRSSIREILSTHDSIKQTREALKLAREQLKGEQVRLDVGKSTSYKVLEIQEDLAQARTNERRALLDFMIARAQLEKAKGTILRYYGLADINKKPRNR